MTKPCILAAVVLLTLGVLFPAAGCSRPSPAPNAAAVSAPSAAAAGQATTVTPQAAPVSPQQAKEMETVLRKQKSGD